MKNAVVTFFYGVGVLFTVVTLTMVLMPARAQYSCEMVRAYVQTHGSAQAKTDGRAQGMTADQEREAHKCFRNVRPGRKR